MITRAAEEGTNRIPAETLGDRLRRLFHLCESCRWRKATGVVLVTGGRFRVCDECAR